MTTSLQALWLATEGEVGSVVIGVDATTASILMLLDGVVLTAISTRQQPMIPDLAPVAVAYCAPVQQERTPIKPRRKPTLPAIYVDAEPAVIDIEINEPGVLLENTTHSAYAPGLRGALTTAQTVAAVAARARIDGVVRSWSVKSLRAAGMPTSNLEQARAIFEAVRVLVAPVRDPVGTEWITYPADLIKSANPAGDCDCQVALFVSAVQSVGIQAVVVLQVEEDREPHLLAAVWDGRKWMYADPARRELKFGARRRATKEVWIDVNGTAKAFVSREGATAPPPRPVERPVFVGVGDIEPAAPDPELTGMVQAAVPGEIQPTPQPWWIPFLAGFAIGTVGTLIVLELVKEREPKQASEEETEPPPVQPTPKVAPNRARKPRS